MTSAWRFSSRTFCTKMSQELDIKTYQRLNMDCRIQWKAIINSYFTRYQKINNSMQQPICQTARVHNQRWRNYFKRQLCFYSQANRPHQSVTKTELFENALFVFVWTENIFLNRESHQSRDFLAPNNSRCLLSF